MNLLKNHCIFTGDEQDIPETLAKKGLLSKLIKRKIKQKIMAYLNKMRYDNNEPINNNTRIDYVWAINKKSKTIHFLSQTITNPHDFWIKALYWLKKDKTVILAKSQEVKKKN